MDREVIKLLLKFVQRLEESYEISIDSAILVGEMKRVLDEMLEDMKDG